MIFAFFCLLLPSVIALEQPVANPSAATINFARYCALNACTKAPNYPADINVSNTVTTAACANITMGHLKSHPQGTGQKQRDFVHRIGLSSDHAGHIFARRFNAPPDLWNMFPVVSVTNNSPMKSAESQIAKIVKAHGTAITEVCVAFRYNAGSQRPVSVVMSAKDSTSTTVWDFSN